MLLHWIWYAMLPNLTLRQKLLLLEQTPDPEGLYRTEKFSHIPEISQEMEEALQNKDLTNSRKILAECKRLQIGILTMQDAGYPRRLRNISDPPLVLYYKGYLPDFEEQPAIGIVGTRKATAYGMHHAAEMARQITACGGLVISGGAAGIDTGALKGALEAGGACVAVLGCGADVVYPRENRMLFQKIEENGCIISEYPPGTKPKPWQFPERNRIISGLANGVLVVEAPKSSGALITAKDAFDQGREVFAVPGNIDNPTCEGSNGLLQEYAAAVMSGWDVLREYEGVYPCVQRRDVRSASPEPEMRSEILNAEENDKKGIDNSDVDAYIDREQLAKDLDPLSRKLVENLGVEPIPVDELIARVEQPPEQVLGTLTMLALTGVVENHPGRLVSLKR